MTGAKVDAFAIETNLDGTKGYHSVFYVKKDSPYQKVEDLKGKNLGLVDPNSTSGNNVPRFALNGMKIEPETFFGKVVYTGSHENAVIALQQGTVDVAANWWNDEQELKMRSSSAKCCKAWPIVESIPPAITIKLYMILEKRGLDLQMNWQK